LLTSLLIYQQELERISTLLEIAPFYTHELVVFLSTIGWKNGLFTMSEILEKMVNYFKQCAV